MKAASTIVNAVAVSGLLALSASTAFSQTITGHSAGISLKTDTTEVVIDNSQNLVYQFSHSCAATYALNHGAPATGQGNADSIAESLACDMFNGNTVTIAGNQYTPAAQTCWSLQSSSGGGSGTGTVTLTGSITGENVILNPKNTKNSLKYSWSLGDNNAGGNDTSVSWDRVIGPTFTSTAGTQGTATTTAVYGQILGCPAGNILYAGQNPQGNPGATPYLYNGYVCAGLAADTQPGNNNDSADRLDYSVPFNFTASDAGIVNLTVSATVKDVAGSTSAAVTVTAGGSIIIHAHGCLN